MKKSRKLLAALGVLAAVMTAEGALAATDGTLGATSTGTSLISLTISQMFKISGLADFAFGTYSGSGALTSNTDVCVYTNATAATYHVLMTDNSTLSPTGFSVQNAGGTKDIPYTVAWHSATGITGNAPVTYNTALAGTAANTVDSTCAKGGKSANLQVTLAASDLGAAPAGAYSTTLTVVLEP